MGINEPGSINSIGMVISALRDDDLIDGMREVWERDGITVAEQVRRAIRVWFVDKGVSVQKKTERARRQGRRRL